MFLGLDSDLIVPLFQIIVTINYRLGALGFMSTNDDVIPGNMGLWDQNMALKWVQDNIEDYGGDPKKVRIINLIFQANKKPFKAFIRQKIKTFIYKLLCNELSQHLISHV